MQELEPCSTSLLQCKEQKPVNQKKMVKLVTVLAHRSF
jgi:hypothetical protein